MHAHTRQSHIYKSLETFSRRSLLFRLKLSERNILTNLLFDHLRIRFYFVIENIYYSYSYSRGGVHLFCYLVEYIQVGAGGGQRIFLLLISAFRPKNGSKIFFYQKNLAHLKSSKSG